MRSQWGRYNLPRDICCHINIAGFDMRNLWDFPAMGRWHRGGYREIFTCHRELKPKVLHQSYGIRQYGYIYIFIWYIIIFQYHFPVICHYFTAIYHNYTTITQYDLLIKSWLTSVNMGNHLWSGTPQADRRSPPLLLRLLLRQGPLQVKAISKWLTISYPSWIHDDSWVIYIYIHNIYIYICSKPQKDRNTVKHLYHYVNNMMSLSIFSSAPIMYM